MFGGKYQYSPDCNCCVCKSVRGEQSGVNNPNYGRVWTEEEKRVLSEKRKGSGNPMFGRKRPGHSLLMTGDNNPSKRPEVRKKISEQLQGREGRSVDLHKEDCGCVACLGTKGKFKGENNPNYGNGIKLRERWKNDPEYVKRCLESRGRCPNNFEALFDSLTPPNVRYVGDGAWWRKLPNGRHKNPDFKVTGENKVIELFGDYWHKGESTAELISLYSDVGIDCLVIWEKEFNMQREETLSRVNKFIMGNN